MIHYIIWYNNNSFYNDTLVYINNNNYILLIIHFIIISHYYTKFNKNDKTYFNEEFDNIKITAKENDFDVELNYKIFKKYINTNKINKFTKLKKWYNKKYLTY